MKKTGLLLTLLLLILSTESSGVGQGSEVMTVLDRLADRFTPPPTAPVTNPSAPTPPASAISASEEAARQQAEWLATVRAFPKVTFNFTGIPLAVALDNLAQYGVSFRVQSGIDLSTPIHARVTDQHIPLALEAMLSQLGLTYRLEPPFVDIYKRTTLAVRIPPVSGRSSFSHTIGDVSGVAASGEGGGSGGSGYSGGSTARVASQGNISFTMDDMNFWGDIQQTLQQQVGYTGRIMLDKNYGTVLIEDDFHKVDMLREFIERTVRTYSQQVHIAVDILEVDIKDNEQSGFSLTGSLGPHLPSISNQPTISGGGGMTFRFNSAQYSMILNGVNEKGRMRVLSRPHILAMSHVPAGMSLVQSTPYLAGVNVITQVNAAAQQLPIIARANSGLSLSLVANVISDNSVEITLRPSVSEIAGFVPITVQGNSTNQPRINERTIMTRAIVNKGEGIVLGGLIVDRLESDNTRLPLIGRIPILGDLTSNRTFRTVKSELIFIVRVEDVISLPYSVTELVPDLRVVSAGPARASTPTTPRPTTPVEGGRSGGPAATARVEPSSTRLTW